MRAAMYAPCMPPLQPVLQQHEITQAEFARAMGLSTAAACRLVKHGLLPARRPGEVRRRALDWLKARGVPDQALKQVDPGELQPGEVALEAQQPTETPKEETMLLQNESLSPDARKHFNLPRNPFLDDVQSPDDVHQTASVRYVRATLADCAQHHGFVAVVGESGAGKTTLAEDLEERIRADKRDIVIIRPYVLAMEANDQKGKTLKSSHIAEAIAAALDAPTASGKPKCILAHTVKGKGVSFMENQAGWHGKAPNDEQYAQAMEDLEKVGEALCQK